MCWARADGFGERTGRADRLMSRPAGRGAGAAADRARDRAPAPLGRFDSRKRAGVSGGAFAPQAAIRLWEGVCPQAASLGDASAASVGADGAERNAPVPPPSLCRSPPCLACLVQRRGPEAATAGARGCFFSRIAGGPRPAGWPSLAGSLAPGLLGRTKGPRAHTNTHTHTHTHGTTRTHARTHTHTHARTNACTHARTPVHQLH